MGRAWLIWAGVGVLILLIVLGWYRLRFLAKEGEALTRISQQQLTTVEFETMEHDFGLVEPGKTVRHEFRFRNTGSVPLVISDVRTSCGCTIPLWTREPVAPGDSGKIVVQFDGSGRGKVSRTIYVYANVPGSPIKLRIYATVPEM